MTHAIPVLVLQTKALKIINKGGGIMTKTRKDPTKKKGEPRRQESLVHDSGTDYVVFICPHPTCGHRNNRSLYDADYSHQAVVGFKCKMCRGSVEVQKQLAQEKSKLIMTPEEFAREKSNARLPIL